MSKQSKKSKGLSHLGGSSELLPSLGDASSAIFLLRDYSRFGLAERICYHFDLTEALADSAAKDANSGDDDHDHDDDVSACGVLQILELAPVAASIAVNAPIAVSHRLSKRQKRFLRMRLRQFNAKAEKVHRDRDHRTNTICYQPQDLPLRCNPSTKVLFGYEKTRIAFCVDASASMTSLFGVNGSRPSRNKDILCPLDRLPEMARIFFASLIEPIGNTSTPKPWRPLIFVTVLAVYPMGKVSETSLLVRDFLVHDEESAELLTDKIDRWVHSEVECGISERLSRRQPSNTWSIPIYSSNLRHILGAGDYALDVMSSEARPVIVVATDGRSISCDGIVDVFLDVNRVDIPVHVLDLSLTGTHTMEDDLRPTSKQETNFLTYDPGGNMGFPLYLTDDSETLFVVCRATGGCFLDLSLLSEAAKSTAGQQQITDELVQQSYSFKRRFVKMNGVQWLALFSVSPISPTFNSSWGKLIPPSYLQKQLSKSMVEASATIQSNYTSDTLDYIRHQSSARQAIERGGNETVTASSGRRQHMQSRTTFSTYVVSPVRIKALLLTRIKEGYRAKQYGLSTHDPDKVFIQFTLPLESGTILHYELSYKALSSENHLVGSAHVKIELSGDPSFIQTVKNDFLHQSAQGQEQRSFTVRQKQSERLCQVIRGMRREDILQSYLKPPANWDSALVSAGTPFLKRLGTLESIERKRHFQPDQFDVVCTGTIPYGVDDGFLSGFMTNQDGKRELIDAITDWSSQTMTKDSKFLKRAPNSGRMTNYCVVEIIESTKASKLFTINVEFFGGTDPLKRFETLSSLKKIINELKNVEVLGKQMAPFLIGNENNALLKNDVHIQFHHASWDLVKDVELLSLLSKRRTEIGGFRLLESRDDYALFAKLASKTFDSPGDLVQYEIAVHADKVVIDLYMESEGGVFNPYYFHGAGDISKFGKMVNVIRRRDQECGRALRSRTTLLRAFEEELEDNVVEEDHRLCVKRLLAYSSRVTRNLRFFRFFGEVNNILEELTSELLLSKAFGVECARLHIDPHTIIRDEEAGAWFIIQFNRQTMSIIHLSMVDKAGSSESIQTFRELTFFTIGISDLYSKRDDLADDDSAESHISEYLCVSDFADRFEVEQVKNFTLAAYLALRQASTDEDARIDGTDFEEVIKSLKFVEVSNFLVGGAAMDDKEEESKLLRSIKTILSPVPGDKHHFFYSKAELLEVGEIESGDSSVSVDDSSISGEDLNTTDFNLTKVGGLILSKEEHPIGGSHSDDLNTKESLNPPLFVRFHLDGKLATLQDLNGITKSSTLTVMVSIFDSDKDEFVASPSSFKLPASHKNFVLEISSLLKSYIAERTLERFQNAELSDEILQIVRKCMAKIRSVVSFVIELYFFISQRDMMMPAAAPAGGEAEVEEGLLLLEIELMNNGHFILRPLTEGIYFLSSMVRVGDEGRLQFWCLLKLQRSDGTISSQIYHPEGEEVAMNVVVLIHSVLCCCINRVNQQLLLKSLHRTRTVSELLVPRLAQHMDSFDEETERSTSDKFAPGIFQCPIVYRKLFGLYHRAATNPGQVARTLEATVLHNFAVSNRPGLFVYKDETGAIFYMKIEPRGSGIDSDGQVELLVYGITKPGPSVTEQLRVLLQRRLLRIGVDMLSSVLTKNPHFKWKPADFLFLRSFDNEWKKLEKEKADDQNDCYYFKFPKKVYDPCLVLLLFRQNLCGSTFFHRLNDISQDGSTPSPTIGVSGMLASGGTVLNINDHDFSLYFNNAPSKLDPAFQGFSTLTEKGADYCRKTGPGIAIVEFTLVNGHRKSPDELHFAVPANETSIFPELPLSQLRMQRVAEIPPDCPIESMFVRIKITDTALKRDILGQWLLHTLDQALVAWVIERMLERSFHNILRPIKDHSPDVPDIKEKVLVDNLCPGLPTIKNIFESSYDLPHAAIMRYESAGVIRSSAVATLTLDLLENCILGPLIEKKMISYADADEKPKRLLTDKLSPNLRIIRLSRSEKPHIAHLNWNAIGRKKATVSITSKNGASAILEDSPVECPEYVCFFTLAERDHNIKGIDSQLRLYREVVIHDGISEKSESIDLLETVRGKSPQAFMRSFGFILSVKRNSRRLWMYNWNHKLVKSVKTMLHEVDTSNLADTNRESHLLQRRSLKSLSPGFVEATNKKRTQQTSQSLENPPPSQVKEKNTKIEMSSNIPVPTNGPTRRIRRPTMIRRPKLIGKSVEGAALQAMAASRKRASTNQFKNVTNPSAAAKTSSRAQINKEPGKPRAGTVGNAEPRSRARTRRILEEEKDETLTRVRKDFARLCSTAHAKSGRMSLMRSKARLHLANIWWPQSPSQKIPKSIAEFLISVAPNAWNDVCALPPLPGGVLDLFIPTLAKWLVALTPGLELLSLSASSNQVNNKVNSLLLCTEVRNVRWSKCCAITRISLVDSKNTKQRLPLVRSEGWILNFQRRSKTSKQRRRREKMRTSFLVEKDSAAMDKVLIDIHVSFAAVSLLFDFSASMVERAVRLLDTRINFNDLVPTAKELTTRYPYEKQKRMPFLNYRAFEATIVLKSYNDRLINMFPARKLFERLSVEAEDREILRCGNSVCLKPISVKGSHSMCFITLYQGDQTKMKLVFLTRTQRLDLADFMFREGSNVAIHVLDNIAIEGSRRALIELHFVAECLLKDILWKSFSSRSSINIPPQSTINKMPYQQNLDELLKLVPSQPFLQLPVGGSLKNERINPDISFLFGKESGMNWLSCCSSMKQNKFFSPSTSIEEKGSIKNLFYMERYDAFLMIVVKRDSSLVRIDLIEKQRVPDRYHLIFDAVVSFILHHVWYNL
eukprot:jgi/Psemu1/194486/e_gw1.157.96.1